MKILSVILLTAVLFTGCKNNEQKEEEHNHQDTKTSQEAPKKKKPLSPHTSTMAMVGDAHVHVDYSSPGVRKRIIFGGLLPYDAVWQAGAHNATWVETSSDLIIDGKTLPKGKYGFFTIPSQDEWTIIFNSNWDQHGKDEYDEKDDVLRFTVTPEIKEDITEHLTYRVEETGSDEGTMSLSWEKVALKFPFQVKK